MKFEHFLKTFRRLDLPWNTGQKKFRRKNYPKTCSKHVLTLLGTILGFFGLLQIFWFFENISKTRPSLEHWAKNFFKKITPKHVQNMFGQIGNDFGRFFNFEIFLKTFRRLDPPWNTRQKNFSKITPKHVQNTFEQFGNDFGRFWNFESFLIFWKHFEYSTLHGALGKKKFPKKVPRNMFKTLLDNLGTILGVFATLNFLKSF